MYGSFSSVSGALDTSWFTSIEYFLLDDSNILWHSGIRGSSASILHDRINNILLVTNLLLLFYRRTGGILSRLSRRNLGC